MNILILGETGVGKSTWINGFQNYLYFDDLDEAMNSPEFHVLIPSIFVYTQDGIEIDIKVGERDSNEVHDIECRLQKSHDRMSFMSAERKFV